MACRHWICRRAGPKPKHRTEDEALKAASFRSTRTAGRDSVDGTQRQARRLVIRREQHSFVRSSPRLTGLPPFVDGRRPDTKAGRNTGARRQPVRATAWLPGPLCRLRVEGYHMRMGTHDELPHRLRGLLHRPVHGVRHKRFRVRSSAVRRFRACATKGTPLRAHSKRSPQA